MFYYKTTISVKKGTSKYIYQQAIRKSSRVRKYIVYRKCKDGGNIYIVGNNRLKTLLTKRNYVYIASLSQNGKTGHNILLAVPSSTRVYNKQTKYLLFMAQTDFPKLVLNSTQQQQLSVTLFYIPPASCLFLGLPQKFLSSILTVLLNIVLNKYCAQSKIDCVNNYAMFAENITRKIYIVCLPFLFTQNGYVYNKQILYQTLCTRVLFITLCCCRNTMSAVNYISNTVTMLYTKINKQEITIYLVCRKNKQVTRFYYEYWFKVVTMLLNNNSVNIIASLTASTNKDVCKKMIALFVKQC